MPRKAPPHQFDTWIHNTDSFNDNLNLCHKWISWGCVEGPPFFLSRKNRATSLAGHENFIAMIWQIFIYDMAGNMPSFFCQLNVIFWNLSHNLAWFQLFLRTLWISWGRIWSTLIRILFFLICNTILLYNIVKWFQ